MKKVVVRRRASRKMLEPFDNPKPSDDDDASIKIIFVLVSKETKVECHFSSLVPLVSPERIFKPTTLLIETSERRRVVLRAEQQRTTTGKCLF